ncbi:MAG: hypothetical protein PHQ43_00205 [Dehalococcoidales bacterium]|nr:hypothetical protein [Dehalococcoidales bacterium]
MKKIRDLTGRTIGRVKLIATRKGTDEVVAVVERRNLVVTLLKGLEAALMVNEAGYTNGYTYCALGTGTDTPAIGDTKLKTEVCRQAITGKSRASNVATLRTFFAASVCTYNIKEAGIFGHDASGTGDSGTLCTHALLSYDNSGGGSDITIEWTITHN